MMNRGVDVAEKLVICLSIRLMDGLTDMLVDPEGDKDWLMDMLGETDARMEEDGVDTMVIEQEGDDDPDIVMVDEKLIVMLDEDDPE